MATRSEATVAVPLGTATGMPMAQRVALAIMVVFFLAAPLVLYPIDLMKVMCFGLFACAFNLLLGYVGLLSFGHAAYFGVAAYVSARTEIALGLPEVAIVAGTLVAALFGLAFGALAIRRQGIYFAMITLALAQLVHFVSVQWKSFTHGDDGVQGVPRGRLLGLVSLADDRVLYYVVFAVFLLGFLMIYRIVHSPFGQVLKAIRENEPRAISLGYRVDHYKLAAFVLSAALAGLAGATNVLVFQIASLTDVEWQASGLVVLITLLGGLGTVFGPVVGAAIIVFMQTKLAPLGAWVVVAQGAIFVACVLLFRRGVIGELGRLIRKPL
jgi:branched-chain amino acid transport system permease protein